MKNENKFYGYDIIDIFFSKYFYSCTSIFFKNKSHVKNKKKI